VQVSTGLIYRSMIHDLLKDVRDDEKRNVLVRIKNDIKLQKPNRGCACKGKFSVEDQKQIMKNSEEVFRHMTSLGMGVKHTLVPFTWATEATGIQIRKLSEFGLVELIYPNANK
jgi:hypothetical protein